MAKYENKMLDIIEALHKSGLLKNYIISGSWAMFFCKEIFESPKAQPYATHLFAFLSVD